MSQKTPCPRCGYANRPNEVACLQCGTRFEAPPAMSAPPPPPQNPGAWAQPSYPSPPGQWQPPPSYPPPGGYAQPYEPPKMAYAPPPATPYEPPRPAYAPPSHPPTAYAPPAYAAPPVRPMPPAPPSGPLYYPQNPPGPAVFHPGHPAGWRTGLPGMWNNGLHVVCSRHSALPDGCVKCGAREVVRRTKKLAWHEPWLYVLLLSPLIYVIVAFIVRKESRIEYGYCQEHFDHHFRLFLSAWGAFGLSILLVILACFLPGDMWLLPFIGGLLAFVGSVVLAVIISRLPILAHKITDQYIWIEGVSPIIREKLPFTM